MEHIRLKLPIMFAGPVLGTAVVVILLVWGTHAAWVDFEQEQHSRVILATIVDLGLDTASALVDSSSVSNDRKVQSIQSQVNATVERLAVMAEPSQRSMVNKLRGQLLEVLADVESALVEHPQHMLLALDKTQALQRIHQTTIRSAQPMRELLARLETDERGWLATDFAIATGLSIILLLAVALISWHSLVYFRMNLQELLAALEQVLVDHPSTGQSDEHLAPARPLLSRVRGMIQQLAAKVDADRRSLVETNSVLQQQIGRNQTMEVELQRRNEELERLNDELREENLRRRRLFADLGHELRTPITAVRGEAEVALRARKPEVEMLREALSLIVDQTRHTAKLLDDLLVLAREESADLPIDYHPVDLVQTIGQALDFVHPLMEERQLRCTTIIPDGRYEILGDSGRLIQVLLVLLDNACRYTPIGGGIQVGIQVDDERVILSIKDNGPGIPESEMPHIFERFFRGHLAQDARPEGSGLGLSVARALVRRHGGQLRIESTLGSGTRADVIFLGLK